MNADALMQQAVRQLIDRQLADARATIRRAVEIGHVDGALMEVALTANGSGAPADWAKALELLRAAAANDHIAGEQLSLVEAMSLDSGGNPSCMPEGEVLGESPRVMHFRNLLSFTECAHIAQTARDLLEPATVVDPSGRQIPHPVRTSHGSTIGPTREDLVIRAVETRIAAITGTTVEQGESLSVLHYAPGQEYRPHFDALPGEANQRIKTVLVYLNDGYRGGETRFMASGLTVAGRAGDAIVFDNVTADGRPDPLSQHAGLPVTQGAKWLATRWIRARAFDPWTATRV